MGWFGCWMRRRGFRYRWQHHALNSESWCKKFTRAINSRTANLLGCIYLCVRSSYLIAYLYYFDLTKSKASSFILHVLIKTVVQIRELICSHVNNLKIATSNFLPERNDHFRGSENLKHGNQFGLEVLKENVVTFKFFYFLLFKL